MDPLYLYPLCACVIYSGYKLTEFTFFNVVIPLFRYIKNWIDQISGKKPKPKMVRILETAIEPAIKEAKKAVESTNLANSSSVCGIVQSNNVVGRNIHAISLNQSNLKTSGDIYGIISSTISKFEPTESDEEDEEEYVECGENSGDHDDENYSDYEVKITKSILKKKSS